jgi:hypothetical protein
VQENLAAQLAAADAAQDPAWLDLLTQWREGKLPKSQAVAAVWEHLQKKS